MPLNVHAINAFNDNYVWLIIPEGTKLAYIVDPGEAEPVVRQLNKLGLSLDGILITHHHPDHVGGVDELTDIYSVPVYGPEGIRQVTQTVHDNDEISIAGKKFQVLSIPGHTLDHIAYYSHSESLLFCGDTLFSNGCGRLFEGTPKQMLESLNKLASLPHSTKVYCGHEYTEANTRFAISVDPENKALKKYADKIKLLRSKDQPTIPSTIGLELKTNPFLRVEKKNIQEAAENYSNKNLLANDEIFGIIRKWKDGF